MFHVNIIGPGSRPEPGARRPGTSTSPPVQAAHRDTWPARGPTRYYLTVERDAYATYYTAGRPPRVLPGRDGTRPPDIAHPRHSPPPPDEWLATNNSPVRHRRPTPTRPRFKCRNHALHHGQATLPP